MRQRFLLTFFISVAAFKAQVAPYAWRDHLGLYTCPTLAWFNNQIYASNYNGIVKIDVDEHSTERLNKGNGLSDVGIRLLRHNPYNNRLLVIYDNANIDVIDADGNIRNYPDIKLKVINGKKIINEVYFDGKFAYLATGLGIMLFDTEKIEIKDTYVIGPGGSELEVYQVALQDSLIFAATGTGLLYSNYKTKILNNFSNWQNFKQLPSGAYSGVIRVENKIIAAYAPSKLTNIPKDTLYMWDNGGWEKFPNENSNHFRKLLYSRGKKFAILSQFGPQIMDIETKKSDIYITSFAGNYYIPEDVVFYQDHSGKYHYWTADNEFGIFTTDGANDKAVNMNGIRRSYVSNIDVHDGVFAVSPSFVDEGGGSKFLHDGVSVYKNKSWEEVKSPDFNNNAITDNTAVLIDRKDPSVLWVSSWGSGLCQFKDNKLINLYNANNSPMGQFSPGGVRSSGLDMDKDGNVWVACSDAREYIAARKRDGSFYSFNFQTPRFTRRLMVDRNSMVWALHERDGGLTVFKHNNFGPAVENVNYRVLQKEEGRGNLGSNAVFSIAEDKDGKVWIGTNAGIRVFYNPNNMFSSTNFDAQPIKIVQDGNVELLLEKETVTAIVVDGANNKWIGTQSSGVFCLSPDGQKEIYHFTKENSPLFSNYVIDMDYDKASGDIIVGSDFGIQTFRSPIIEGEENYNGIHAYPNPVKPGYSGHVFVRGLVDESIVKITDESGNLVWETKSTGGQIEWPVTNLSGARAASGVYIVYAAIPTGELKALTKVLVVN